MKKLLFISGSILLLASACNNQQPAPGQDVLDQQNQNSSSSSAAVPLGQQNKQGQVYESQYLKITVPAGWVVTEPTRTVQDQSYDKNTGKTTLIGPPVVEKTGAVNIEKGNYILYINTQASQASGVTGGRFAEIAMGAPSADAVVIDQPNECGTSEVNPGLANGHPRADLYISAKDKQQWCTVPSNGQTVWFFSYIADQTYGGKGYFNYYTKGQGPTGYVITMAYNSKDVNKLPVKGSKELNQALNDMTNIIKTLEIKQQ